MEKTILDCRRFQDYLEIIDNMYRLGWDERNGGNISLLLDPCDVDAYLEGGKKVIREIPLPLEVDPILVGKVFAITGTGRYFRNTKAHPSENTGVIRIKEDRKTAEVLWGFDNGSKFTSEIFAHMMCHATRLKVNPNNHVIMHCHPQNILTYSSIHDLDEESFTKDLWRTMTEEIVVFPEGIGVLPWELCGTNKIGVDTAEKMKEYRCVVWTLHGIYGAGDDLDEAFGLIETVEKACMLYLMALPYEKKQVITDENLKEIAAGFHLSPKEGYLK